MKSSPGEKQRLQEMELALQNREAEFRSFVENSFDVIFILDAHGVFRFVSPSWEQHFGYPATDVIGLPFAPVVHPEDVEPCFNFLTQVMSTGIPGTSPVYRVQCEDGSWKKFIANGSRFIDPHGETLFHGIGRDITMQELILEQLKSSEEKFAKAFNHSPALMSLSTIEDGRYLEVNDQFCTVSGLKRKDVIGRTSVEIGWISADTRGKIKEILHNCGRVTDIELELRRGDGKVVSVLFSAEIVIMNGVQRLLSIAQDITGRLQTDRALQLSEERYKAIVNTQSEFLNRFKPGGVLTFVNDAFCRFTGLPREELLGQSFLPFVQEEDRSALIHALAELSPDNPTIETVDRLVYPDGKLRWQNWTSTAIFDSDGQIVEYQAVGRDITEQKKNLDALDYANECFNQALGGANHILYRLNMKTGNYDYLSPAFEKITGYSNSEFSINAIGKLRELVHPDDRKVIQVVDDALLSRQGDRVNLDYEFRLKKADGEYCWLHDYTTACFNDAGELECFFGSAYDLTSRKEMESELRRAHDELEERVARRTAELAEANEQIKLMSFQLIRAEELERGRIASELHDQVGQSLLLAKMNLDLLTNDIATVHERKIATNISNLLASTIDDIRTLTFGLRLPLLETAGLDAALQWLCTRFLEDFRLKIEYYCNCSVFQISSEKRYSLFQAIRELLLNVAKHGKVDTAELKLQSGDGSLVVYVIDRGVGFNPAENGQKPSTTTSLGIFNVRQRIKQLGGSFEFVSAPGQGTIAYISIPLDR